MAVGNEISVGRNEEAGPLRHHRMRFRRVLLTVGLILAVPLFEFLEELVEWIVLWQVWQTWNLQIVLIDFGCTLDLDADHRRGHLLHQISKAQRRCSKQCLESLCRLGRFSRSKARVLPQREQEGA